MKIHKGILYSLLTAFISGTSIYINSVFALKSDPLIFAWLRNFMVFLVLSSVLLLNISVLKNLSKKQWLGLLFIGLIGGGLPFALFFTGISKIGAVNANLINKTLFLWASIMAIPVLKEKINRLELIGFGLIFYPLLGLFQTFNAKPQLGLFLVLGSTLLWSFEYVLARYVMKNYHIRPMVLAWGRITFGLPVLSAIVFMVNPGFVNTVSIDYLIPVLVSSLFLIAFMFSWFQALSVSRVSLVSSVLSVSPLVTLVFQNIFSAKGFSLQDLTNNIFILFGIYLVVRNPFSKYVR